MRRWSLIGSRYSVSRLRRLINRRILTSHKRIIVGFQFQYLFHASLYRLSLVIPMNNMQDKWSVRRIPYIDNNLAPPQPPLSPRSRHGHSGSVVVVGELASAIAVQYDAPLSIGRLHKQMHLFSTATMPTGYIKKEQNSTPAAQLHPTHPTEQ